MPVRTVESVLLALRIEMSTRRLEVGSLALGHLVKVDGMLPWRQVVQVKLQTHTRALIPDHNFAHGFALGIFHFHLCFGCAPRRSEGHGKEQSDGDNGKAIHRLSLL